MQGCRASAVVRAGDPSDEQRRGLLDLLRKSTSSQVSIPPEHSANISYPQLCPHSSAPRFKSSHRSH